jgi:hypothetical protein
MDGSVKEQLKLLRLLRHVTNVLEIPIIVSGIPTVKDFLSTDTQITSRFKNAEMPWWPDANDIEFRGFLQSAESTLKLHNASELAVTTPLAKKIRDMAEGLTGEIVDLLKVAATKAIESKDEKISETLLNDLLEADLWTEPARRRL